MSATQTTRTSTKENTDMTTTPTGIKTTQKLSGRGKTATDAYDAVTWESTDIELGKFQQSGTEFPAFWTQQARQIAAQKYFRGNVGQLGREFSARQMITRVAGTIATWGREQGYFATDAQQNAYEAELTYVLLHQMAAFNSPVWFNVGHHPVGDPKMQASACFILGVQDRMEDILQWNTEEGLIFRGGSGAGVNLSNIRAEDEPLSKGGFASGPVSFMRGADAWAGSIKSGGGTRRAAKMVVLDIDHPDVEEFIDTKAKEEDKAIALRNAGFDVSLNGEASRNLLYQNANNSVRLTDAFMDAVANDEDWDLIRRSDGAVAKTVRARELYDRIARAAHRCADPGVQYDTTINRWHTTPGDGRITASNPCSEYMSIDNSACNLASINLMRFRGTDGTFDIKLFEHVVDVMFLAQEIIVGESSYPTERIVTNANAMRQLGLGYANLGALIMSLGFAYDSDEGRGLAGAITSLMGGRAYQQSAQIAKVMGPYDRFTANAEDHLRVMGMHLMAAEALVTTTTGTDGPAAIAAAGRKAWAKAMDLGTIHGFRNAQATVLAPTGTISFLMGCDTTGIEPGFSLVTYKDLVGGGKMKIVNQTVPMALQVLGYDTDAVAAIVDHIDQHDTIIGAPGLAAEHLPVFDVAVGERAISWRGHLEMMAAVQPFLSGAISKTVNLPSDATVQDIADAYTIGWQLGLKAVAIYRDGSKSFQVLNTAKGEVVSAPAVAADGNPAVHSEQQVGQLIAQALATAPPRRRRMPVEAQAIRHKFAIGGQEGYVHAGVHEDGSLGEVFISGVGKEGSTLSGMFSSFATVVSVALHYGVPLETLVEKFAYMRFEPEGPTGNPEVPFARSIPDYIMRWLASRFLSHEDHEMLGILTPEVRAAKIAALDAGRAAAPMPAPQLVAATNGNGSGNSAPVKQALRLVPEGMLCDTCGSSRLQRTGSCFTCQECGTTSGCG